MKGYFKKGIYTILAYIDETTWRNKNCQTI